MILATAALAPAYSPGSWGTFLTLTGTAAATLTHAASDVFVLLKAGRPARGSPSRKSVAVDHRSVPR
jgi:hypothetical protein